MLQAGGILERAIDRAADAGYSAPELGDRMRDECPGIMTAIENIGEEQEARDRLPDEVDLDLGNCGSDEVTGTVTNNSDLTVDIFIDIVFFDIADQQVGDSIATVRNVETGVTARWSASVFESYDRCRATVGSVFES